MGLGAQQGPAFLKGLVLPTIVPAPQPGRMLQKDPASLGNPSVKITPGPSARAGACGAGARTLLVFIFPPSCPEAAFSHGLCLLYPTSAPGGGAAVCGPWGRRCAGLWQRRLSHLFLAGPFQSPGWRLGSLGPIL